MRKCKIDKALAAFNAFAGLKYPAIGYSYYANIAGDGRSHRTVYTIINENGGVTISSMNGATPRQTLAKINSLTQTEG